MQEIIRRMVERSSKGYSNDWQPIHPRKYQGYEVRRSGVIQCCWQYDGGPKRRRDKPVIVKPYQSRSNRYLYVTLRDKRGNYVNRAVHLLVAKVFLGKQPAIGYHILHWNGWRHDNRAKNLLWMPKDIRERRKAINFWKMLRKEYIREQTRREGTGSGTSLPSEDSMAPAT